MHTSRLAILLAALLLAAGLGCSGSTGGSSPNPPEPPPSEAPSEVSLGPDEVVGSEDSVSAVPGSADALYRFRFRQIEPPGEFNFQDRDLSFYWKPAPSALHFQVENRQDRPVWIEWERSTFYHPSVGRSGKVAHASTRWDDRYRVQPPTQINGLQRYGDYVLPMEYLIDPAGSNEQLHRPLFPEDATALQYENTEFGADLVFRIDDRMRTYRFRFKVSSILPR